MNQAEIDALLKQRAEEQTSKEQLEKLMAKFQFNQNLQPVAVCTDNPRVVWLHSERKCECVVCGIAASNYCVKNDKKVFACPSCFQKVNV